MIRVNDLVKTFGDLTAVNEVSFEVAPGEVFGFLGPNGAGKSTTISMLCTLLPPTSGTATVNGFDINTQKNSVRASIGLVFQDPSLDDRLTARENLEFHAVVYHVPKSIRQERIDEVMNMVMLTDRIDDRVNTFSGGMKRRLEIARGLLHYPRILFLDEPTIGLDPQTRNYIWSYIENLRKRTEITIFLTTHYMEEAEHCDRIAIIDQGRIIALDTPAALKNGIGGDVIKLKTEDDDEALALITEMHPGISFMNDPECRVCFKMEKGEEFIPRLIEELGTRIISVSLHKPTLDDVFLKLTGKEIREEGADPLSAMRRMRRH